MVLRAALMKSGLVSINTARQNISKTTVSVNTARQVNTTHSKTTVNAARPMSYLSKTTYSTVQRPIHKKPQHSFKTVILIQGLLRSLATARQQLYAKDIGECLRCHARSTAAYQLAFLKAPFDNVDREKIVVCNKVKVISKAFRVFNSSTMIVEENLHIRFSESTPNAVNLILSNVLQPQEKDSNDQEKEDNVNNTNNVNDGSTNEVNVVGGKTSIELPFDPNMPALEDVSIFDFSRDDEDDGSKLDRGYARRASTIQVTRSLDFSRFTKWKKGYRLLRYTQQEGIDYDEVFAPVARIEAIRLFLAYASFKDFVVYQMIDVKSAFLYGKIEEEVYVCQPPGFEDPDFPDRVYKVEKALYGLHQAPRAWYETLSTYLLDNGFQRGKIDKTLFIKRHKGTASTPMETHKPLLKDKDGEECVPVLDTKLIKVSHLHAVKRIFRYLKGQPKLGLWYPKDSPFDLVAYTDSDYARASLDRKSTTGGCQFLRCRLISWQCKKQTVVANSTTKAEYVAASSCCRQVLWIQNQLLDYGSLGTTSNGGPRGNTLRSDEDRLKLNELMELCTTLQKKVLDLEKTKTTQANEIASLKRRVKKLEKKDRLRTHKLKRLYKVGLTARVESSKDKKSLGEDASKHGRINAIDADEDITLVNVQDDADKEMYDVGIVTGDEVFAEQEVVKGDVIEEPNVPVNVVSASTKVSAATTKTATIPTPRKGIVITELGTPTIMRSSQQPSQAEVQDKGKGKMIEPEPVKKMSKKDQLGSDEEEAKRLQTEFNEEERLAREKDEANVALLQAAEQEELYVEEKAKLFQQLLEQRRKNFVAKSVEEKRNKPPTQAQQRKIMCTYLKNMEGKKLKDLKNKSFDSIQKMFDKAFKRVDTFVNFRIELVEGSSKRAGEELEQESTKKQKVDEDKDTTELQSLMEVISDEKEVAIDVVPLATKPPTIVEWKIHKEGKNNYFQIIRADGSSK
ncbi:retrovirus-related pol polyprotein from transposon TNT 1-94, partial [Tanacetum coccineum]